MTRILYMACDWIITIANIMAMILTFVSFIKECKKKQIESLVLKVSILILMFIMLAAHYFQHSYAEVPNLVGLEYKNACALLADRNINFIDNEEYSGGNYFVVAQSLGNGNVVNVKGQEVIELVCERRYVGTDSENQKEEYSIINLGESVFFVQVGEIISIEISISTPEKYKFETTPFVLYCGFYSREKGDWVQISSMYVGAGEENYSVHIDTGLLGLSDGEYIFSFSLFSASNYSKGRSIVECIIQIALEGESEIHSNNTLEEAVSYERINDIFVINGKAYRYDIEELRLWDIDDDDLQKISQCNNLKVLQISGENITNLTPLQNLVLLEELHIRSEELEELMPISGLTQLRVLSVGGMEINGIGFSGKLKNVPAIESLVNLESLSISDCQVEDIGIVRKLFKLKSLWIYKTPVYDISPLCNLVLLEDVRIHNNNIMDISSLYELSNLKVLALSNNPIPQEQIDFLKEQIPNCKIIFN